MALLPSVSTKITVELTRYRSAVSEFLAQTLGKSINYLIDKTDSIESVLDGATVSEVNSVSVNSVGNNISYTVTTGYTFVGTLFARAGSGTSAFDITITQGQLTGTFGAAASTTAGFASVCVPQVVSSGGTIAATNNFGGSGGVLFLRGVEIKSASLTIP